MGPILPQSRSISLFEEIKLDIIYSRETHIKVDDRKYLVNKRLGEVFISAGLNKRNGVVLDVKSQLKPKLVILNKHGRFVAIKVNGIKTMLVVIYITNEDKSKFLDYLIDQLTSFTYENWCLLCDWNG